MTRPPPEPKIRGKSLTEWLILADNWDSSAAEKAQGVAAVKEIGTNAVPYLLYLITKKEPANNRLKHYLMTRGWFEVADKIRYSHEKVHRTSGVDGFRILQADAASAIPELKQMVSSSDLLLRSIAVGSLIAMGEQGQKALVSMLGETNLAVPVIQMAILTSLVDQRSFAIPEMVPVILSETTNTVWQFRWVALQALHSIPEMTERKVEILQGALKDTQPIIVDGAIRALQLNPAVLERLRPQILGKTNWPDQELSRRALQLLTNVSPSHSKENFKKE